MFTRKGKTKRNEMKEKHNTNARKCNSKLKKIKHSNIECLQTRSRRMARPIFSERLLTPCPRPASVDEMCRYFLRPMRAWYLLIPFRLEMSSLFLWLSFETDSLDAGYGFFFALLLFDDFWVLRYSMWILWKHKHKDKNKKNG